MTVSFFPYFFCQKTTPEDSVAWKDHTRLGETCSSYTRRISAAAVNLFDIYCVHTIAVCLYTTHCILLGKSMVNSEVYIISELRRNRAPAPGRAAVDASTPRTRLIVDVFRDDIAYKETI